jgi:hypothetical protein
MELSALRGAAERACTSGNRTKDSRADLLRHFRYEHGRLVCDADYVRGRMMKTTITVVADGKFMLTTTNRGEAASRWVAQI